MKLFSLIRTVAAASVVTAMVGGSAAQAAKPVKREAAQESLGELVAKGDWTDVTNNVGGETWGAYGVHYLTAVPSSNAVIAGISERGLWGSTDNGATWSQLGKGEIKFRPDRIVFDPKNTGTFWVSGCYGDSPWRTDDGGKSFKRLGKLSHSDGISVDFGDPQRRTLLLGLHEQAQSVQLSTDGGNTWTKIGANLPAKTNHSSDPLVLDSKTFLVNAAGYLRNVKSGIYRSEDAGQTWTSVSDSGPTGQALLASDGAIYWEKIYSGGLLKSTDKGKTWTEISKGAKTNPIELPGNRLASMDGKQIVISSDGGKSWTKFGPPMSLQPTGFTFSAKGKAFYGFKMADNQKRPPQSIVRLDLE